MSEYSVVVFTTCKYINRILYWFTRLNVQHVSNVFDIRRAWFPLSNRHMKWRWSIECQYLIIKQEKKKKRIWWLYRDWSRRPFLKWQLHFLLFNIRFLSSGITRSFCFFFFAWREITPNDHDDEGNTRASELRITRRTQTRLDKTCEDYQSCTLNLSWERERERCGMKQNVSTYLRIRLMIREWKSGASLLR